MFVGLKDEWYLDIAYFLTYRSCPDHLKGKDWHTLQLRADKFVIIDDILYKRGLDGMFLRCIDTDQHDKLLRTFHDGACGGHFLSTVTAFKILRSGYYWPGMFKAAYHWVRNCEKCQLFARKPQLSVLPLKPLVIEEPFQ